MNRAVDRRLVDRLRVNVSLVLTGRSGALLVYAGAEAFDVELLESRTLNGRTLELTYRPTRH